MCIVDDSADAARIQKFNERSKIDKGTSAAKI